MRHTVRHTLEKISRRLALNDPLLVTKATGSAENAVSFLSVDRPNVVIETVKQAEDGSGLVARLYESQRQRGRVALKTGFALSGAERTNLLETPRETLEVRGNRVSFEIKPFEIVTLKLKPS